MASTFPPEIDRYVREQLASNAYASEEELILDAIRIHRELACRHQKLRDDIRDALAELDRGEREPLDMDEIKAEVANAYQARKNNAH